MSREHTPRPGVTWEQQLHQVEQVLGMPVTNDDYRRMRPQDAVLDVPEPAAESDTRAPDCNLPQPPRPNRATRRAMKRIAKLKRNWT